MRQQPRSACCSSRPLWRIQTLIYLLLIIILQEKEGRNSFAQDAPELQNPFLPVQLFSQWKVRDCIHSIQATFMRGENCIFRFKYEWQARFYLSMHPCNVEFRAAIANIGTSSYSVNLTKAGWFNAVFLAKSIKLISNKWLHGVNQFFISHCDIFARHALCRAFCSEFIFIFSLLLFA